MQGDGREKEFIVSFLPLFYSQEEVWGLLGFLL